MSEVKRPLLVLVDDEPEILSAIKRVLMRVDIDVEAFTSPRLASEYVKKNKPLMVISDLQMPDIKGIDFLTLVKNTSPSSRRILMSAFQDFDAVAEGFNQGIIEQFISKPWNNLEFQTLVESAIDGASKLSIEQNNQGIITNNAKMLPLLADIKLAAGANVPVFIYGETGTGKELVAKACHKKGAKKNGKFIAVNCANFSESLIESQLFGHKKGAFTGAVADQKGVFAQGHEGTIFLDEITTLPLPLQSKLLRVIQERVYTPLGGLEELPFDAQIVSASSTTMLEAVSKGEFREDLYYRLNVISLNIPPLRERGGDVVLLAHHFLEKFSKELNQDVVSFDETAEQVILAYSWPGNVRQLENVIHSACIMHQGKMITSELLKPSLINLGDGANIGMNSPSMPIISSHSAHCNDENICPLHQTERYAIEDAIDKCDGCVTKAAVLLEVNPSTLYRKIKSWQT